MILKMKTEKIIKDLKNLEDIFNFSNLEENHELFSTRNKRAIGKFKIEIPTNAIIDEFLRLRSKMSGFKCGDESENTTERIKFIKH